MSMSSEISNFCLEKVESKDLAPPFSKVESKVESKVDSKFVSKPVKKVVERLSEKYNFEVEEALRWLSEPKSKSKSKSKSLSAPLPKVVSKYPMPFDGLKRENCCNGIVKNHGLYTQCSKKVNGFCKGCELEPYGNIDERVKVGLYEYKDPKGKNPKRYTEVLKKLKITKEEVEEDAKRLNIVINAVHFEEVSQENVKRGRPKAEKKVKESAGKKGRPKKEKKVVEVSKDLEEEDLFATLIANAQNQPLENQPLENQPLEKVEPNPLQDVIVEEVQPLENVEANEEVNVEPEVLAPPLSKVEKVEKVEKVDKKQKNAEDKAAKEAAKEAEKQKKAEEKAAKEAAKEAEKQKKAEDKAAKEAAKEAEKQKKAEEKAAKEAKKKSKDLAPPLPKVDSNVEEEADVVKKIEFEGKPYYKSKKNGIIYNMEQEVVGKWNEERNEIDFDEEEEEEEYDD